MTHFEPEVEEALKTLNELIENQQPELHDILSKATSQEEAIAKMFGLLVSNPDVVQSLESMAMTAFEPLRDFDVLVPTPSGVGVRLDPLYEASLGERLQFDGDAPELRFGAIGDGIKPAVPVLTDATNPIAVGMMLEQAAEEVYAEQRAIEATHVDGLVVAQPTELTSYERDRLPDPVGYLRGHVPELRTVEMKSGWGLLALSEEQKHELAWKALSTTQGRTSIANAIQDQIGGALRKHGWIVFIGDIDIRNADGNHTGQAEFAYAEWVIGLSGPESTQPLFSFADVAWRALYQSLAEQLRDLPEESVIGLSVSPVNTVSERRVGFKAIVYKI